MIKLGLWKNDRRTKSTQPPLSAGKPVEIEGKQYWLSAYINTPKGDDATAERVQKMIDHLAEGNGTYPLLSISLVPAEQRQQPVSDAPLDDDDVPF